MLMPKRRVSRRIWHKLLGILRSSTPAIYGAQHLFSLLQYALTHTKGRIRMTQLLRAVLTAWLELATDASSLPTPIMTVVPRCPTIYAATDASKAGMGGFWVSHSPDGTPQFTAWRSPFSAHIQERLVTADNTTGTITNNDLELTALIVGASLAAAAAAHQHPHIAVATDNTSACAWASKGSTTTGKAPAYLLHTLTQLRRHRPFTLLPLYTSGDTNTLADCCSRSFHLSDAELLAHLNAMYPSKPSWTLVTPPNDLLCKLSSALSNKLPQPVSLNVPSTPVTTPGTSGQTSALTSIVTPTSPLWMTPYPSYKSLCTVIELAHWLPVVLKSAHAQWKAPFVPLARRSPHWDALIPVYNHLGS